MNVIKSELIAAKETFEHMFLHASRKHERGYAHAKIEVFEWLLYQFDFEKLETKAAKWDMIQWAIGEGVQFIWNGENRHVWLTGDDLRYLERLYKESEQDGR